MERRIGDLFPDQPNNGNNNMNTNQQQQQNIPRFSQHNSNNYTEFLENRLRDGPELVEEIHRLNMARQQLHEILQNLNLNGYNLQPAFLSPTPSTPSRPLSPSPLPPRLIPDSELLRRTTFLNATPPYPPRLAASNGINITSAASGNLNLPVNLFDDNTHNSSNQIFQYSQAHDSLQHRFPISQSSERYYINHDHQPANYRQNVMNYPNSLSYNYNGIGLSGMQCRETSPSVYDHHRRLHDNHEISPRRNQYQNNNYERMNVVMAAKDEQGSRFLQEKITQGCQANINMIFSETKGSLCSLMMHKFGFHLVQKLIDVVDDNKLDEILHILTTDMGQLVKVCADDYGARVMKYLVAGRLRTPQQHSLLASAMSRIALSLTRTTTSNSVIYQCLRNFLPDYKKLLLRVILENCLGIAQDKAGCCCLQKCLDEADEEIFNRLGAVIIQNADTLSENSYGNYVVQYLIKMKKLEVNRYIVAKLRGKFVGLSMNKYGSNVVETLLNNSGLEDVANHVITEILDSDYPLKVSQDPYGNYVIQSAMHVIEEGTDTFDKLKKHIFGNRRHLQNHMYGKKVLQAMTQRSNIQMTNNV